METKLEQIVTHVVHVIIVCVAVYRLPKAALSARYVQISSGLDKQAHTLRVIIHGGVNYGCIFSLLILDWRMYSSMYSYICK